MQFIGKFFIITLFLGSVLVKGQTITINLVEQRKDGSMKVDVLYDLEGSEDAYDLAGEVSLDNGATWQNISNFEGDFQEVAPGVGHLLIWNAGEELPGQYTDETKLRFTLSITGDMSCPEVPSVMHRGQRYGTVQIGTQCWMASNMNAGPGGWCLSGQQINCDTYGRLYSWGEAMNVCPPGWHLPSSDEWNILESYLDSNAGGKLKTTGTAQGGDGLWHAPNAGATNSSGFSALPAGHSHAGDPPQFHPHGNHAHFWTSTGGSSTAQIRMLSKDSGILYGGTEYAGDGFSVRCIRDQ